MFRPIADLAASGALSFTFDGQPMTARAGDTVAAALLTNGITACRETPVSDTPRAPYCLMGVCFDCLVTIDGVGNVAAVGGIKEKLVSAERAGAEVFFVPSGNCADMDGVGSHARIVSVSTLDDAINALDALADPATEGLVKGCT